MGYAGGVNLYAYVGNNPVNESDPLGTSILGFKSGAITSGLIIGLLVAGGITIGAPVVLGAIIIGGVVGTAIDMNGGEPWGTASADSLAGASIVGDVCAIGPIIDRASRGGAGPPDDWPTPPGWNGNWQWRPGTQGETMRWFDEDGGEWRLHGVDSYHPTAHWDYNEWGTWNSGWENKDFNGNIIPK